MNGGIILNDNDFRNESQRYFDEMMKLYAKSGNANSNAEGVQSGPSSALGNSIPVNNNSATQRINNAERMSDNNMSEPEINLNEVREMPQGQTGTEQQPGMMREIPQGQTVTEQQSNMMREMPQGQTVTERQPGMMREMPQGQTVTEQQSGVMREMPQGQTVTEQQPGMMREIPQGQTGMETQNRLMRETMDRNGDDSQKSAVERLAENIFSEAEISNMENDVREDESNFENRFPSPIIPDFIRQSSPRQENRPVTVTEPGISSRTTGRTANPVNSEHGFLKVEVRTGENGIPVSGAAVSVTKKNGKEEDIMFTGITDESGSVPIIELPAPPMGTGNTPESFEHYETYMVSAYSNGFYREVSENVPIFSGITSIQRFNLIPEPFNYDDMGRSIVIENTEPDF
jgi:5-hydroxyisourate hydrolase-like protein (transthyretin family)